MFYGWAYRFMPYDRQSSDLPNNWMDEDPKEITRSSVCLRWSSSSSGHIFVRQLICFSCRRTEGTGGRGWGCIFPFCPSRKQLLYSQREPTSPTFPTLYDLAVCRQPPPPPTPLPTNRKRASVTVITNFSGSDDDQIFRPLSPLPTIHTHILLPPN